MIRLSNLFFGLWLALFGLGAAGCGNSPTSVGTGDDLSIPATKLDLSVTTLDLSGPALDLSMGCTSDANCSGVTPHCNLQSGQCVGCTLDAQCPDGQTCAAGACPAGCSAMKGCGDAGVCDVDAGVCRSCASDGDCADPQNPRCDVSSRQCVPCLPAKDNCPSGKVCHLSNNAYACVTGCKSDLDCPGSDAGEQHIHCCASVCIDTTADSSNCGACGNACNQGKSCCGAACTDPTGDVANCGACGNACNVPFGTPACVASQCAIASCNKGRADCDKVVNNGCEVNTDSDALNCQTCGTVCATPNGVPACSGGCAVGSCNQGFGDCDKMANNGCEANLGTDVSNCGVCGMACPAVANGKPGCAMGKCGVGVCSGGFLDCDMNPANGCEVDPSSDIKNCGACGMVCPALANGIPACSMGKCVVASCNGGFADCDGNPMNGCETATATDTANCGACGKVCAKPQNGAATCSGGVCNATCVCNVGFADCDKNCQNGCETEVATDLNNCGACGQVCAPPANSTATCAMGVCNGVCGCSAGFGDCDKSCANGCEVNLRTDVKNCGACGAGCPNLANGSVMCSGSQCVVGACNKGFGDCDKNPANGCEVVLASDVKNCGACGVACTPTQKCANGGCLDYPSCAALLGAFPKLASGVYTIDPDGAGGDAPFAVFCEMQADGGGWTLLVKLDGSKQTFTYDAALWTDKNLLNANDPKLDTTEGKFQGFISMPYAALRVGMIDGGTTRWLVVPTVGTSLYNTLNKGFKATTVGRAAWKSLLANPSLQPNCNQEGFDDYGPFGNPWPRVRIGILGNQENDCGTPDSWIGFGGYGAPCGGDANTSCGNVAPSNCNPDNGPKDTQTIGYVMVR